MPRKRKMMRPKDSSALKIKTPLVVQAGANKTIKWISKNVEGTVSISLSRDGGTSFPEPIAVQIENVDYFDWLPYSSSENCVLKIVLDSDETVTSTTSPFTIEPRPCYKGPSVLGSYTDPTLVDIQGSLFLNCGDSAFKISRKLELVYSGDCLDMWQSPTDPYGSSNQVVMQLQVLRGKGQTGFDNLSIGNMSVQVYNINGDPSSVYYASLFINYDPWGDGGTVPHPGKTFFKEGADWDGCYGNGSSLTILANAGR